MKFKFSSLTLVIYLIACLFGFSSNVFSSDSEFSDLNFREFKFETDAPIFVVGDIHGAYSEIVRTLMNIKLIDENHQWIGEKAHFVSVGDLMDRGPASRKVMDLFIQLQQQAEAAGGKFHVALGNHEVMNLIGDLRYLSDQEIAEFSQDESPELRDKAYKGYLKTNQQSHNEDIESEFNTSYPAGYFARKEAFSEAGVYGKWLLSLPFVVQINDQLFAHGGLSKLTLNYSLEKFNKEAKSGLIKYLKMWEKLQNRAKLSPLIPYKKRVSIVEQLKPSKYTKRFLRAQKHFILSLQGPTWYRGNAQCHPYFENDILSSALNNWQAKHLWVGHTTSQTRTPLSRLDNQLTIMDTGMLASHYQGTPWISRFSKSDKPAYINGLTGVEGKPDISPSREWSNPYNFTDKQVEDFLLSAEVKKVGTTKEGKTRPYKVELTKDGKTIKGIFKYKDTGTHSRSKRNKFIADRYQFEMAAYKLDRLLGIGLVPVTVERKVNGQGGIIQVWVDDLISELEMVDNQIPYHGYCDKESQDAFINSFDYLIANRDRNQSNVLYTRSDMQIWFIDHSRSFGVKTYRPKMLKNLKFEVSERFKKELQKKKKKKLKVLLPYLKGKQVSAILKRRDKLLAGDF